MLVIRMSKFVGSQTNCPADSASPTNYFALIATPRGGIIVHYYYYY